MKPVFEMIYVNPGIAPPGFEIFLPDVFQNMANEIEKTAISFYSFSPAHLNEQIKGVDKIFSSIERTWVGLFNNALIKTDPAVSTLQEFAVWSNKRQEGRCDLLFEWDNKHFIVEAKSEEYNKNWRILIYEDSYHLILKQAYKYYSVEQDYYHKDTFIIALMFEWVKENNLEKFQEQKNKFVDDLSANPATANQILLLSFVAYTEESLCMERSKRLANLLCQYYNINMHEVCSRMNWVNTKKRGNFTFNLSQTLQDACDAPDDKCGIYLIYKIVASNEILIYIRSSGQKWKDGSLKIRNGGMKDRLINGYHPNRFGQSKRIKRHLAFPQQMRVEKIETIKIYWWVTYDEDHTDFPTGIESKLVDMYSKQYNKKPDWHKQ